MSFFLFRAIVLALCLTMAACSVFESCGDTIRFDETSSAAFDRYARSLLSGHDIPALAIAVAEQGNIRYQAVHGNAPPAASFHLASVSKPVTALAVMGQVRAGRLDLDAPISRYLPNWSEQALGRVTLRQLLTHSAGLPDVNQDWWTEEDPDGDDALARYAETLTERGLEAQDNWRYSNAGFDLIGAILERITGEPFDVHLRKTVLAPMGMGRATFRFTEIPADQVLLGHHGGVSTQSVRFHPYHRAHAPSSTLHADLESLVALVRHLSAAERSWAAYTEGAIDLDLWEGKIEPVSMGLGWFQLRRCGVEILAHGGRDPGHSALMAVIPEHDLALVIAMNKQQSPDGQLQMLDGLLQIVEGREPTVPPPSIAKLFYNTLKREGLEAAKTEYMQWEGSDTTQYRTGPGELSWAGHALIDESRPDLAAQVYAFEATRFPEYGYPHFNHAVALHQAGDVPAAQAAYRRAVNLDERYAADAYAERFDLD